MKVYYKIYRSIVYCCLLHFLDVHKHQKSATATSRIHRYRQMMTSSWLLTTASLAFTYATPCRDAWAHRGFGCQGLLADSLLFTMTMLRDIIGTLYIIQSQMQDFATLSKRGFLFVEVIACTLFVLFDHSLILPSSFRCWVRRSRTAGSD